MARNTKNEGKKEMWSNVLFLVKQRALSLFTAIGLRLWKKLVISMIACVQMKTWAE
jgi:hypothetical protein